MIPPTVIKEGTGITISEENGIKTVGIDSEVIRHLVRQEAVYSINGQYAAPDGSFFIHGSECDSWHPGYEDEEGVWHYNEGTANDVSRHSMTIVDLCPACQTCDTIYSIKKSLEYLEVYVNELKDVMLHRSDDIETGSSVEHGLDYNKQEMLALSMNGGPTCVNPVDTLTGIVMQGMQLLQQYITVAHMWNYAVNQNNASFKLEIAPEDTAGFVIQTKRSLPQCNGKWQIRCTVTVQYVAVDPDDPNKHYEKQGLSVYVPEPTLRFKPFQVADDTVNIPGEGHPTAEDAALNGASAHVIADLDFTTKTIQTDYIIGRVAGTYELTVKILPFINFVMLDAQGHPISVRGGTINTQGHISPDGKYMVYDFAPASYNVDPIQNPTEAQYLDAKTAPTASVPFNNIWQVNVLWEVGKVDPGIEPEPVSQELGFTEIATSGSTVAPNEVQILAMSTVGVISGSTAHGPGEFVPTDYFQYSETRMYTCTGVRAPNTQAIISDSTIPIEVPITTATTTI